MGGRVGGAVVHDPSLARKQTDYMLSVPEG